MQISTIEKQFVAKKEDEQQGLYGVCELKLCGKKGPHTQQLILLKLHDTYYR